MRLAFAEFKQPADVAAALGVDPLNLPTRGFGLVFGANVYPLRKGAVTFGVGAECSTSSRSRAPDPPTDGSAVGPTVRTELLGLLATGVAELRLESRMELPGGGLGWGRLTTEIEATAPVDPAPRTSVLNYGGGARWFARPHLAVTLDLRFYAVSAQEASAGRAAYPKTRLLGY